MTNDNNKFNQNNEKKLEEKKTKLYSYVEIQEITRNGLTLKDGTFIDFEVCVENAREYFKNDTTFCVAERNLDSKPPYFIFFSNTKVKIVFNGHKGLFAKKKNYIDFQHMQQVLQSMNFSTYDLS